MTMSAAASRHSTVTATRALGTSASRSSVLAAHATVTTADNTATIVYRLGTRKFDKNGRGRANDAGAQEMKSPAVNAGIAQVVEGREKAKPRITNPPAPANHYKPPAGGRRKGRPAKVAHP